MLYGPEREWIDDQDEVEYNAAMFFEVVARSFTDKEMVAAFANGSPALASNDPEGTNVEPIDFEFDAVYRVYLCDEFIGLMNSYDCKIVLRKATNPDLYRFEKMEK